MSEDFDKVCRAILYQLRMAKTLEEATKAVEVIVGAKNIAEVDGIIAAQESKRSGA